MKFEEALQHLREGKKIRRSFYAQENYICSDLQKGEYFLSNTNDKRVLSAGDVCADDWELYIEPQEERKIISNDEYIRELDICRLLHKEKISQLEKAIFNITDTNIKLSNRLFELENKIAQLIPEIK